MYELKDDELKVLRYLQHGIPIEKRPFSTIADMLSMKEEEIITILRHLKDVGVIKRLGASVSHYKIGILANAMCAWKVDAGREDEVGELLASQQDVSHCYLRETDEDWDYNLFVMIHATSR
ncbi:MAG: siroheme decarboxylase subunit beta, partial [Methermicoccaceae archaeon]